MLPQMMFNLIVITLRISIHGLGLEISGKIFVGLIGTVLLCNTLKVYTAVNCMQRVVSFVKFVIIFDANLLQGDGVA